jgi:hypothetical protein
MAQSTPVKKYIGLPDHKATSLRSNAAENSNAASYKEFAESYLWDCDVPDDWENFWKLRLKKIEEIDVEKDVYGIIAATLNWISCFCHGRVGRGAY